MRLVSLYSLRTRKLRAAQKAKVRRGNSQKEAFSETPGTSRNTPFDRLKGLLKKEKALPRKRKGLEGKVKGWFQDFSADDRNMSVAQLFEDGLVKESNKKELVFDMARLR